MRDLPNSTPNVLRDSTTVSALPAVVDSEEDGDDGFGEGLAAISQSLMDVETPVHALAPQEDWGQVRADILRATRGKYVPGLGGHGDVAQFEEWIDLDQIVENPFHVRHWDPQSDEVQLRKMSIVEGHWGQIDPITVTPLTPDHPLATRGSVMVVDGKGTLLACREARVSRVKIKVVLSPVTKGPLTPYEMLNYWLTKTLCHRPATKVEIALGFVRMRLFWEQMNEEHHAQEPFLSNGEAARNMGVDPSTITHAYQIANQPGEIFLALSRGLLLETHVLRLHQMLPNVQERLAVARRIIALNGERLHQRRPLLPASMILKVRDELYPARQSGQTALPDPKSAPPRHVPVPPDGMVQLRELLVFRDRDVGDTKSAVQIAASELLDAIALLNGLSQQGLLPSDSPFRSVLRTLNAPDLLRELRRILEGGNSEI